MLKVIKFGLLTAVLAGCGLEQEKNTINPCGIISHSYSPKPSFKLREFRLSGSVQPHKDGTRLIINPIVSQNSGLALTDGYEKNFRFKFNGLPIEPIPKQGDRIIPLPLDIVLFLDTTDSMTWALESIRVSISSLLNQLKTLGYQVQIAGVEFGDSVRSFTNFGPEDQIQNWLAAMSTFGGGDQAENLFDPMMFAWQNLTFKKNNQRLFIVISNSGFHEKGDGTTCASHTLDDVNKAMGGRIFPILIHGLPSPTPIPGISPELVSQVFGGALAKVNTKGGIDFASYLNEIPPLLKKTKVFEFSSPLNNIEVEFPYSGKHTTKIFYRDSN